MKTFTMFLATFALAATLRAEIKTEPVEYKQGDTTLRGMLAYDDAVKDKRPAVIIVPEWWGLNDYPKTRAKQLAELGYVAFAIDMYGDGKTTEDPKQAGEWSGAIRKDPQTAKARFDAALDALKKNEHVDANKIAAIGYCFGGGVVVNMARAGEPLAGVVSFHGAIGTDTPAKPGAIKTNILVCHGGDDPMVTRDQVAKFEKEMKDAGANYEVKIYDGAQHSFTNPAADRHGIKGIAYNEKADKESWEAMKNFLAEIFK
jgi:dienelactone hydrolase